MLPIDMKNGLIFCCVLFLAGCINIATIITPVAPGVREERVTSDCVPIFFGFSYGTASLDKALATKAPLITNANEPHALITKVRFIALHDYYILLVGERCVEITGESATTGRE